MSLCSETTLNCIQCLFIPNKCLIVCTCYKVLADFLSPGSAIHSSQTFIFISGPRVQTHNNSGENSLCWLVSWSNIRTWVRLIRLCGAMLSGQWCPHHRAWEHVTQTTTTLKRQINSGTVGNSSINEQGALFRKEPEFVDPKMRENQAAALQRVRSPQVSSQSRYFGNRVKSAPWLRSCNTDQFVHCDSIGSAR